MLLRFSHKLSHLRRPAQASNICQCWGRAVPSLDSGVYVQPGAHIVGGVKSALSPAFGSVPSFAAIIPGSKSARGPTFKTFAVLHGLPWQSSTNRRRRLCGTPRHHPWVRHRGKLPDRHGCNRPRWRGYREQHHQPGAGAVVPGGYSGPEGVLLLGAPAGAVRNLTAAEIGCVRGKKRADLRQPRTPLPARTEPSLPWG